MISYKIIIILNMNLKHNFLVPTQHLQLVSSLPPTVYHVTFPASSVPQTQSFTLSALSDNALYEPDEVIHFDIYCTPDRMILDVPSSRLTVLIQDGNRPGQYTCSFHERTSNHYHGVHVAR